jgi:hypothetical protein
VIPQTAGVSGVCGVCGVSLEALTREKIVFWLKLYSLTVERLKQTPLIPQTPQPPLSGRLTFRTPKKLQAANKHYVHHLPEVRARGSRQGLVLLTWFFTMTSGAGFTSAWLATANQTSGSLQSRNGHEHS